MKPLATCETDIELVDPTLDTAPRSPILITEKEVLFSTAAAVPVWPRTIHWWPAATHLVLAATHRMFLHGVEPRQHHPKRYEFLERACLAREMDRL
jgi:hypothetical protein